MLVIYNIRIYQNGTFTKINNQKIKVKQSRINQILHNLILLYLLM